MGCCGEKRKQWMHETKPPLLPKKDEVTPEPGKKVHGRREFEYTGNHSLVIKGATSGKTYHFRFRGDKQFVEYYDAFAMMAESDLKPI